MGRLIVFGSIKINSNSGTIVTGNSLNASPISTSKSVYGSGSNNTGYFIQTNNGPSSSTEIDPDAADSNII